MLAVTKAIDSGAGVLYIYGNYNGDIFNFDMATEMAAMEEDIRVESVVAGEDVASARTVGIRRSQQAARRWRAYSSSTNAQEPPRQSCCLWMRSSA